MAVKWREKKAWQLSAGCEKSAAILPLLGNPAGNVPRNQRESDFFPVRAMLRKSARRGINFPRAPPPPAFPTPFSPPRSPPCTPCHSAPSGVNWKCVYELSAGGAGKGGRIHLRAFHLSHSGLQFQNLKGVEGRDFSFSHATLIRECCKACEKG